MVKITEIPEEVSNGGELITKEVEKEEEPKVSSSSICERHSSTVLYVSFQDQSPTFSLNEFSLLDTIRHVPRSAIVTIGSEKYFIGVGVGQHAILIDFTTQQYRLLPSMRRALAGIINQFQDRSFLTIPSDHIEICIALVRKCDYPAVSQVCRYFRDLLASSRLYITRSDLGVAEDILYTALGFEDPPRRGLRLCVLNGKKLRLLNFLPRLPEGSAVVTIGGDIYVFGGCSGPNGEDLLTDAIHIDCRTHKYRALPSMRRGRYRAAAGFIDGMIYVIGGYREQGWYRDWIEVFYVEEEVWSYARGPHPYAKWRYEFLNYLVIDEELYIWDHNFGLVYEPLRERWSANLGFCPLSVTGPEKYCVMNKMIFAIDEKCRLGYPIVVYDPRLKTLKPVKGISLGDHGINSTQFLNHYWTKMASIGGKLVILGLSDGEYRICCVKIGLERRQHGEIWGNVETVDVVFEDPEISPSINLCTSVTM